MLFLIGKISITQFRKTHPEIKIKKQSCSKNPPMYWNNLIKNQLNTTVSV